MKTTEMPHQSPIRPEDVLPDAINQTEIGGLPIRKGTVAAFLQNAIRWNDPATGDALREELSREMANSVPSLRALGIFEVFEARDMRLRDFLASN